MDPGHVEEQEELEGQQEAEETPLLPKLLLMAVLIQTTDHYTDTDLYWLDKKR